MKRMRPLLGTFVEISAIANNCAPNTGAQSMQAAISDAFSTIESVHALMSFHSPDSELTRLNLAPQGKEIKLHPYTLRVLRLADGMARASGGLFNHTLGGALVRRGHLPDHGFADVLDCGNAGDIHIGKGRARRNRNVCITLDGIAKGFAVDMAIQVLKRYGITSGWINAGGDMRAFGGNAPPVVRREHDNRLTRLGVLRDGAVASSRVSETRDSRFPAYITAYDAIPTPGVWTVAAASAWRADALTKVACLCSNSARRHTIACLGGQLVQPTDLRGPIPDGVQQ